MNIVLVEDHELIRHGIRSVIDGESAEGRYLIADEFATAEDALASLRKQLPDIVITDIHLPKMSGLELAKEIRKFSPKAKILLLSSYDDEEYVIEAITNDINGYILRDSIAEEILTGLERISNGESYYCEKVMQVAIRSHTNRSVGRGTASPSQMANKISPREKEVLIKIADGYKNSEIAQFLFISERTVETHRASLLKKLSSKSSAEMIKKALMAELI